MDATDYSVIAIAVGTGISLILHAIAPYTKTKIDDKIADAIDRALGKREESPKKDETK